MQNIGGLTPIGAIRSPYRDRSDAPFQGKHRNDESILEIFENFEPALMDIEKSSHLIVLYWQDRGNRSVLQTKTPWGPDIHGVFATRSPDRPNPIGFCVVELLKREGRLLRVKGMDALDGSPLLDIKPYSSGIDSVEGITIGWRGGRGVDGGGGDPPIE